MLSNFWKFLFLQILKLKKLQMRNRQGKQIITLFLGKVIFGLTSLSSRRDYDINCDEYAIGITSPCF